MSKPFSVRLNEKEQIKYQVFENKDLKDKLKNSNGKQLLETKNVILNKYLEDIIFLFDILNTKAKWKRMPKVDDPIWDKIEEIDKYVEETKNRND